MGIGRVGRQAGLTVTIIAIGSCVALSVVAQQAREFGQTIARITVGQDGLDRVRFLYGSGAQTSTTGVRSLCYYVEQDQSYLCASTFEGENRVRSISLTTFQDVTPGCRDAKITGKHLVATRGVALGDSMAKVVGALGQPKESGKIRIGDRDLVQTSYPAAGGHATCLFDHDKLVLIGVELD